MNQKQQLTNRKARDQRHHQQTLPNIKEKISGWNKGSEITNTDCLNLGSIPSNLMELTAI